MIEINVKGLPGCAVIAERQIGEVARTS